MFTSARNQFTSIDTFRRVADEKARGRLPLTASVCGFHLTHRIASMVMLMKIKWRYAGRTRNAAGLFYSLAKLIEESERQLSSVSSDNSEYLFWRLRTLSTFGLRNPMGVHL